MKERFDLTKANITISGKFMSITQRQWVEYEETMELKVSDLEKKLAEAENTKKLLEEISQCSVDASHYDNIIEKLQVAVTDLELMEQYLVMTPLYCESEHFTMLGAIRQTLLKIKAKQ